MSSEGDTSPISALVQSRQDAVSPADVSSLVISQEFGVSEMGKSTESVTRRPFLKRGSRMPKSKIPADIFTPVVVAIKNPPKALHVSESEVGAHDLQRPVLVEERRERALRPITAPPVAREVKVAEWEEIATKHTEDLDAFLRDIEPPASFRRVRDRPPVVLKSSPVSSPDLQMQDKIIELDAQIAKFRKENEYCKKLRVERETALGEAQRFKEKALRELEAAEKDIDEQRALVVAERRKLQTDRDRGRAISTELRKLGEENRSLSAKLIECESTKAEQHRRMKNEISRLTGIVAELQRSKFELELELRRASREVASGYAGRYDENTLPHVEIAEKRQDRVALSPVTEEDDRQDDGRREVVFPSGLKKTVWPDGSAVVVFPNGDTKETSAEGVVLYHYAATGCTQTTYLDKLEVLQFASGQIEKHFPDGSKEIVFPNKTVKRIDKHGNECR